MKVDPHILRAERLRAIMSMPEYHATIGAWLEEAMTEVQHNLSTAVEMHEVHRAQGAFKAITSFKEQFDKVLANEQAAVDRQYKRTVKVLNKER